MPMKNVTEPDAGSLVARAAAGRWNEQKAADWYAAQPWLVGCNFLPGCASNQARNVAGRHLPLRRHPA
ncbi:MAG: hypothetical protein LBK99_11605 [Opitutaceae bacterium]|nr:hypothetical protein [Opitutaceae bacterium]